jgi:transcriptional regulator with XRE-family HTH domain
MGRKRSGQPRAVRKTVAGRFGQRPEQLATAAGLTTAEFARKAGVTEDAINKYFRGTDVPRLDRWPRIARALGLKNAKDLLPDVASANSRPQAPTKSALSGALRRSSILAANCRLQTQRQSTSI